MKHRITHKAKLGAIGLLMVFALIVAACSSSVSASDPQAVLPETGGETVMVASHPEFGDILVTTDGMTLYTNTVDSPDDLKCTSIACTGFWPPYTVDGEPSFGEGVTGEVGTVTRPDGSTQITYNRQPLYTFYLDDGPGDTDGEGFTDFGGTWHVVPVDGTDAGNGSESGGSGGIDY